MANDTEHFFIEVRGRAEIGGTEVPVCAWNISYPLNRVPRATIYIPIGQIGGGANQGQASTGMGILKKVTPLMEMKVYATLLASSMKGAPSGKSLGFPNASEFLIFNGLVSAPATMRQVGRASIEVSGIGVLAGLAGTTGSITGVAVAGIGNGSSFPSAVLGEGSPAPTIHDVLADDDFNVTGNFWENVLLPIFEKITDATDEWSGRENQFARPLLQRINSTDAMSPSLELGGGGFPGDEQRLQAAVINSLVTNVFGAWEGAGQDLFQILYEAAQVFRLTIAPAIDGDGLLPITLCLGGEPYKTIDPSEYWTHIDMADLAGFYDYLTRVGVYSPGYRPTQWAKSTVGAAILGYAEIPPEELTGGKSAGRMELKVAPPWLVPSAIAGFLTLGFGGAVPDASNPKDNKNTPDQGKAETEFLKSGLGDMYAESILYDELFAQRRTSVTGRFRADIAPGSLIKLVSPGKGSGEQSESLFAHVANVTLSAGLTDAGSFADTRLDLVSVRTEAEQSNENLTVDLHPLWQEEFRGAPLSEEAAG